MIAILSDVNFWVIALGTMFLGFAAGMVGSVSVLRGQSLIGDAIGHSSFPGVVIAFMLVLSRNPSVLMIGALFTGIVAYLLIQAYAQFSKTTLDTALAIVLSSMFGLGMVLKSHIQGNADYGTSSQAGLQTYIFGQAAYLSSADLRALFVISGIILILIIVFYKEIKLFIFDLEYAKVTGFKPHRMQWLTLLMTMALIVVGLRVVGAILIASMLISPTVAAQQWTNRYHVLLIIGGGIGMTSAFLGTWISATNQGVSTGPAIIVCMSIIAIFSLLLGPRGVLRSRGRLEEMVDPDMDNAVIEREVADD